MILAKLGMGLLGTVLKKGASTAIQSGLSGTVSSGLASSLGQTALSALGGNKGGKGGGKGGGMGGGKGGGRGGQSSQKGQGGGLKGGGKGRQSQNSQSDESSFSLEDALNMLLEQNNQQAARAQSSTTHQANNTPSQLEAPDFTDNDDTPQDDQASLDKQAPAFTTEQQIQVYQETIALLQASVVSFSSGRVRLRHPQLKESKDHVALQKALLEEGLSEVTFKASTGSALIIYDTKRFSDETFWVATLPLAIYLACAKIA